MLHKTEGLKSIAKLLEQKKTIPRRYAQMAELMQADLAGLEDDSLDHISRRMNDVTRRLDIGHAGKRVRGIEDGIIASLDKLIKQKEDEAAAAGSSSGEDDQGDQIPGGQGGNPHGIRSTAPARKPCRTRRRSRRSDEQEDRQSQRLGGPAGQGTRRSDSANRQGISLPLPRHYRAILS